MLSSCYGLSIGELLERVNESSPEKEAVYDGVRRLSYKDLLNESNNLASGLAQIGIQKGDRVAICLPTWYEFITIVFAVAKIGAVVVPLNTRYRENEAEYILKDSGAKVVFFTETADKVNHLAQFLSIKKRNPAIQQLISVRFEHEELMSYQEMLEIGNSLKYSSPSINVKEDLFCIVYTSGTTGTQKGVMITHDNMLTVGINSYEVNDMQKDDVILHVAPYFHVMGLGAIVRLVLYEVKAVILETFNAKKVLQLIEQEKITVHVGVPSMYILELKELTAHPYDLTSLRKAFIAGAPCPVETIRRVKKEMNCVVQNSYGMTETSLGLTYTNFDDDDIVHAETVGKAIPGVELKVVNDSRREVPIGDIGELACKTPGLMKGYYNLPDKTKEAIDEDGWFYTGDLVSINKDGYVKIVGRKKDMIIRGGYNIYPTEIEELFYLHPSIIEAAIVGLPNTVLGEASCAALVVKENSKETIEDFERFIKDKIADYKKPDHIVLLKELPKTASGKVKKHVLKEQIVNERFITLR
ncbi:class I adenylate-forming enzyme family protein [Niallia oryzisoli]|uniref:Class I adenylate-forming enzyme family protein n=1 Tax=Niallia oryzisoli TaxID=1737571 RepID=A0ABZ2CB31_9BACI